MTAHKASEPLPTNAPRSITEPRTEASEQTATTICGANPVLPSERVGCGKPITGDVYRCTECTTPFHHHCAIKHFGQHGDTVITDTTYELLLEEKDAELQSLTRKLAEAEERHRRLKMSADTLVAAIGYVGEIRADDEMVHNLLAVLKRIDPQ